MMTQPRKLILVLLSSVTGLLILSMHSTMPALAQGALPQKSWAMVRFGFAVGCEAAAMPRRQQSTGIAGCALGSGLALGFVGPKAEPRAQPKDVKASLRRGIATASHPAAKPSPHQRRTFRAKLAQADSSPNSFSQSYQGQTSQPQPQLSAEEKRGKAFYLRGETSTGKEITALIGEIDVPASTVPCAGCHGARGEGTTEGGVTAGNLTWSFLTKPYGHLDDGKRKHPAFSQSSFIRTMTSGADPAGNKLSVVMPTYQMPQQEMADLIAYLKRIETDSDPGLTETSIVLGTLLPDKTALTGLAQSMGDVLQAYFAEVNSRGGIYRRKIELRVMHGDATTTLANMKHLIDDEQVFAIVGGLIAGADESVAGLSQEKEVPFIGPTTLLPQRGLPLNRYVFYLLPGLKEQARALVSFAAKKTDPKKSRVAIICPDADFNRQIAASLEDRGRKLGWTTVASIYYARERFETTRFVAELKQQGIDTVFLLGSGADAGALFRAVEAASWTPSIYLFGSLVGRDITELIPVRMKDDIFLVFPTIAADVSQGGAAEYSGLLEKYKLGTGHAAAQASAIAAAKILVHGLERSGKDVSRERLVTTLEGLYEFDTGLMPRITFGPNRRIGSYGAYIVTLDPEKKLFPATVEWIAAE